MTLDEAIRGAIEYEAGVHRTYVEAMKQATDDVGKRVFKVLCDEEMGHLRYLRERLEEWQSTGKISVEDLETSMPTRASIDESLQQLRRDVAAQPNKKRSAELQLLQKALVVEGKTSDFYKEMVRTLDGDGRRMFERFVEIEEGHQRIVQAEIDSLNGMGYWFDTPEFNLEA